MSNLPHIEQVAEIYRKHLHPEWELYVSPYLNGAKPDLVALHENYGVCFLVINLLELTNAEIRKSSEDSYLIAGHLSGHEIHRPLPIERLKLLDMEVRRLYGFRLGKAISGSLSPISLGLILPNVELDEIITISELYPDLDSKYFVRTQKDLIDPINVEEFLPQLRNEPQTKPIPALADIRNWLANTSKYRARRETFNTLQKEIDENPREVLRRRVRGGPGSGKTEALVSRAARLADEGKEVLFLSFNITLLNELRDRFLGYVSTHNPKASFLNIHAWCDRTTVLRNRGSELKSIWARDQGDAISKVIQFAEEVIGEDGLSEIEKFDVLIIDEAQDMEISWIKLAENSLRDNCELLLAADQSQDIYQKSKDWNNNDFAGLGFRGPWIRLKDPKRTPPYLVKFLNDFAQNFEIGGDADRLNGAILLEPRLNDRFIWECASDETLTNACIDIIKQLVADDKSAEVGRADISVSDITVLVDRNELGTKIGEALHKLHIRTITTMLCSWHRNVEQRQLKLAFSSESSDVKISTIHSYKGFGSTRMLVAMHNYTSIVTFYTALSRIKSSSLGQSLYVVSANPHANNFYKSYSRRHNIE
jgi:hypothetical protein